MRAFLLGRIDASIHTPTALTQSQVARESSASRRQSRQRDEKSNGSMEFSLGTCDIRLTELLNDSLLVFDRGFELSSNGACVGGGGGDGG